MEKLVDKLTDKGSLEACEYRSLLLCEDARVNAKLSWAAREASLKRFGNGIYIRGLIEVTNICRNDCLYCGIRKSNGNIERYKLSQAQVLECCRYGYRLGFRTFVLQGGELPDEADDQIIKMCSAIHKEFPDCTITLSLGERSDESYRKFREAGASRYLLRHETHNQAHYSQLHPAGMSLQHRLHCISTLKSLGYQTGTGIMVGSPYQSIDNIVEDIQYIEKLKPEMIGLGPFIPHKDTVFAEYWKSKTSILSGRTHEKEELELTLKLISIFRLMFPDCMIPSTTALATLSPEGRELGILSGANVVMPNLSPPSVRGNYSLYDNKASSGSEAAEGLEELNKMLKRIGYETVVDRGDYRKV